MGKLNRLLFVTAALTATAITVPSAIAESNYPSKPITLINPYSVGGPADLLARALVKELGEILGQPFVVESKAGGGASIGASYVAKAAPDGYTLLLGTAAAHTVTPSATKVNYHGINDFEFIGMVANVPNVLTVHPSVPSKNLKEFIALAKAEPSKFSYASSGMGTSPHIGAELFKHAVGLDILHVPYKGAAPAANDLVSGVSQVGFLNISGVLSFIKANRLRALAYGGSKRSPDLPDVPTFAEAGVPNIEMGTWYSIAVPAKTPTEIVEKLAAALELVQAKPEFKKVLAAQNAEAMPQRKKQASEFIKADGERLAELVRATSMKLQD